MCLALLISSYFIYGKYVAKQFDIDANAKMPSETMYDGVDYLPLPRWKTFLIQLLNIAGLGPIFGAILGACYGPVAFLWITFGGILIGSVHDFASGYISIKMNGASFTEITSHYLGKYSKYFIVPFMLLLMVLVGAVFMVGPAVLLNGILSLGLSVWIWIILAYYLLATLLPIDKIIGKIYPIFGFVLIFMALGLLFVIFTQDFTIPEINFHNFKIDAETMPIIPTLFITIACGAVSGFHATQSPLMARCLTSNKQTRPVFFGAMISESTIALIWAAIAMAFFGGVTELNQVLAEHGNNAAYVVDVITSTTLGKFGAVLAMLGVVAAPISSGDTAFRSARLMVADFFKLEQKTFWKRIIICVPLFAIGFGITLMDYGILWRYFAWCNQALAVLTLWVGTLFLTENKRTYFFILFPAMFMTYIVCDFFLVSAQMLAVDYTIGSIISGVITSIITILCFMKIRKKVG
jgi:carbon starvation protein CstA